MRSYFRISGLMSQPHYVAFLGGHAVRGFVMLDEVGHCVVTAAELDETLAWTPKAFTQAADDLFRERMSNQGVQAPP